MSKNLPFWDVIHIMIGFQYSIASYNLREVIPKDTFAVFRILLKKVTISQLFAWVLNIP